MTIDQTSYDRKPLFIRQGALDLWGVPLAHRVDLCRTRKLFQLSDFFAEMCFDLHTGQLTCICTFTQGNRLTPYLDEVSLADLTV